MGKARMTATERDAIVASAREHIIMAIEDCTDELRELAYDLGPAWYPYANSLANLRVDDSRNLYQTAGFISALSPMTRWATNVRDFDNYFEGILSKSLPKIRAGKCVDIDALGAGCTLDDVKRILNGPKTMAFVDNIVYPWTSLAVTIDTIMCQGMGITAEMLKWAGLYDALSVMIAELSVDYGFDLPCHFQAFVWIIVRGEAY
jgi:hypothetical protein